MNSLLSKIKSITTIVLLTMILAVLSGCVSKDGKVAMSVAKELMETGSYEDAAKQCAIAVGNGVTDKEFVHMYEILKSYNAALDFYKSGDLEKAQEKISEISDYSGFKIASDIEKLKDNIKNETNNSANIDKVLEKVEDLCDIDKYDTAQEKMLELDEYKMTDEQKSKYRELQEKINSKSKQSKTEGASASSDVNYSQYDSTLSKAYIMGADTGNVYLWNSSTGNGHSTTIPNGTTLYVTTQKSNGRTLVKWNGKYGWITSKYVNMGDVSTYTSQYHIEGASSGSVYVWKYPHGDEYYATISNGTVVYPTGEIINGRVRIRWGNGYGWVTDEYVG